MRVLIFAFLALAANAYNYGYSSYPSYSHYGSGYGSGIYGLSYGSGIGYGSGLGYTSGIGYGSGLGYGSGITYGVGGGHGHYTTAYKPVYQTASYSDGQQYDTGPVYNTEYSTGAAPGRIAFTLGGTGYQTGPSSATGSANWRSAVSKPYVTYRQRTASVRHSGAPGVTTGTAPGRITFTQNFSGISRQSNFRGPGGSSRISTGTKTVAPVAVVNEQYPTDIVGDTGIPETHFQEIANVGDHGSTVDFTNVGGEKISLPVSGTLPRVQTESIHTSKNVLRSGAQAFRRTGGHSQGSFNRDSTKVIGHSGGPHISFVQDFSRISGGQTGIAAVKPEIGSFTKVSTPIRTVTAPRVPSRPYGEPGAIRRSGFLGNTGGQPQISFVRGSQRVRGQSQQFETKPEIFTFDQVSAPVVTPVRPLTGQRVGTGVRKPAHTFSAAGPSRISFVQDFSKISGHPDSGINPVVPIRRKVTAPAFPGVLTPAVAPKPVQKPVTENLVFQSPKQPVVIQQPTLTIGYDQSPVQDVPGTFVRDGITEDKSIFTRPRTDFIRGQAIDYRQEITNVRDQKADKFVNFNYAPGTSTLHDKSSGFDNSAILTDSISDVSGDARDRGNFVSSYKVSSVGHTEDKSNIFVAVPVEDKSSALLQSSGVAPTGNFGEEKGSLYQVTSGNINPAISSHAGRDQASYSALITPPKSYYSSSYPGYSHVSGESPRFEFSHDKSLLYSSPDVVSPHSYPYYSDKEQSEQVYKKSIA